MRIELSDFIANIYERYNVTRQEGFSKSARYSDKLKIDIPLFKEEKQIPAIPLYAYMCLNELQRLGSAKYSDLFKDIDTLSGAANGIINQTLAVFANLGVVSTTSTTMPIIKQEYKDGTQLINNPMVVLS